MHALSVTNPSTCHSSIKEDRFQKIKTMLCILTFADTNIASIFPLLYKNCQLCLQPLIIPFWISTSESYITHFQFPKVKKKIKGQKKELQTNIGARHQKTSEPQTRFKRSVSWQFSSDVAVTTQGKHTHTRCYCENGDLAVPRFPSAKTEFVLWIVVILVAASGRPLSCASPFQNS